MSLSGSHAYTYDARGQVTGQTDSVSGVGSGYSFSMQYNDAGQPTSLTYSDGEVLGTGYNAQGWLNQLQTTPSGGSAFTLATGIGYTGNAGAAMQPTSASIANGTYTYTASFDADLRLVTDSLTSGASTLYSATRGYDAVGNVISEDTQLVVGAPLATDNQLFCYDEQNRLTWAGATGTSPCNGAVSSGTLTSAYYTQSYAYDAQGRLTSGAIGSYTYGDAAHPHAVTSIGGGTYTARYDAAGDLTCRAPNSSVTCAGTPTGATLTYDAERRLAHWQNTPSSPTVQDDSLYDGAGQRVEQYVNTSGTITSTAYLLGGVEEVSGGVVTKYLGAKGLPTAVRVGTAGSLNYLASDGLGSVSVAVDGSGNVVASQLFGPYGAARYASGTMPTSKGFTGQRADATTELDYYGARYYDPAAGQFVSADSVKDGLSRYAYVHGNPETATDPSGHLACPLNQCGGGGGGSGGCIHNCGGGGCTSNCGGGGCTSDANCGCYDQCGAPPTPQPPTGTPSGQKPSTTGNTTGQVLVPSQHAHISIHPDPWNVDAWFAYAKAALLVTGGVLAIIAGFQLWAADPLAALAAVINGINFLIHAAMLVVKAVAGEGSGLYGILRAPNKTRIWGWRYRCWRAMNEVLIGILSTLGVIGDFVSTVADGLALTSIGDEAGAAEVTLPLLKNVKAIQALYTLTGIDLYVDLNDLNALADGNMP